MNDVLKTILFVIVWILLIADRCFSDDCLDRPEYLGPDRAAEVADVMFDLLSAAPRRRLAVDYVLRREFAEDIVTAADEFDVPEFLLTKPIFHEYSFRTKVIAKIGRANV